MTHDLLPARFDSATGMLAVRDAHAAHFGPSPDWDLEVLRPIVAAVNRGDILPAEPSGPHDPRLQPGVECAVYGPATVATRAGAHLIHVGLLLHGAERPRWVAIARAPEVTEAPRRPPTLDLSNTGLLLLGAASSAWAALTGLTDGQWTQAAVGGLHYVVALALLARPWLMDPDRVE